MAVDAGGALTDGDEPACAGRAVAREESSRVEELPQADGTAVGEGLSPAEGSAAAGAVAAGDEPPHAEGRTVAVGVATGA